MNDTHNRRLGLPTSFVNLLVALGTIGKWVRSSSKGVDMVGLIR